MGFRKNLDYLLSTELDWPGVERVSLEDSLVAPVRGLCFPRGSYRVKRHTLRIVSWNGFFELKIDGEASGSLTVYPGELPMEQALPGRRDQAPEKPAWLSWMKDRDLFESRSYFAGDDPRKINWKMLALHDELYIKEGSSLSPSRRSALMIIDASGNRSRTDRLFRHFSFLMDTLKDAGLKIDGFLPGEGGVKDLHSLCRTDKEDLLASLPPSAPGRSIPSGPYGVLYFFAAALPGRETLKHLEESFPEARRILVLPRAVGPGLREAAGERVYGSGRWYCVRP